jgi:hypothetical protein
MAGLLLRFSFTYGAPLPGAGTTGVGTAACTWWQALPAPGHATYRGAAMREQ